MSIAEDAPRNTAQMPLYAIRSKELEISEEEMNHRRAKVWQIAEKYDRQMTYTARWLMTNYEHPELIEDAVQEALFNMLVRPVVIFPENAAHELRWVLRAVRNSCKDLLREEYARRTIPLDSRIEIPDHRFRSAEDEALARIRYVQEYASPQRRMIIEGATRKQRAANFGVTEGQMVAYDQKWERDHR